MSKNISAAGWIGIILAGVAAVALVVLFAGWIVYLLWPVAITLGLPALTYWECTGLFILANMLFKTFAYTKPK